MEARLVLRQARRLARRLSTLAPAVALGQRIRDTLDAAVIGQSEAKEAIVLAILAKEHVYLEGPPGVSKTFLAETAAESVGLATFVHQMHRDTRLSDLTGDPIIVREAADGGEVIAQRTRPGALLTCEFAVLDDVTRAPGEALNVLLRILNERRFDAFPGRLPLLSAIATANPPRDDFYNEALDPANLDRFALQVRTTGLLASDDLDAALDVVARYGGADEEETYGTPPSATDGGPFDARAALDAAHGCVDAVSYLPEPVAKLLLECLRRLARDHGLDETNAMLTDRTFLVKAPRVLKAAALRRGSLRVEAEDLRTVLPLLTTFRVPPEAHAAVPGLVDDVLKRFEERPADVDVRVPDGFGGARAPA